MFTLVRGGFSFYRPGVMRSPEQKSPPGHAKVLSSVSMRATRAAFRRPLPPAFSLVELLAVVAIVILMAAVVTPAVSGLLASQRLSTAMADLSAQFALARQHAITAALPVELRIYELPEDGESPAYRAIRLVRITDKMDANGRFIEEPLSRVVKFPTGIAAVAQQDYSTLLTDASQSAGSPVDALPGQGDAPYRCIRFLPNGRADLPLSGAAGGKPWSLTVAASRFATAADLPANYGVLVVEPLRGITRSFRP